MYVTDACILKYVTLLGSSGRFESIKRGNVLGSEAGWNI
jgi:hypothetical protein